ncbi:ATP-binding protein [Streptomyces sp. G44]|uniref:ATP-binding protein n=1 Tax=Streptomyces sp. G44 TaxID=2807632 RepID=UPI00195FB5E2|nr:ATP-binding protein [Streptomyces sp. G44]MBM7169060.1 ATP-binding protein [Streptomyces sp. G44]
MAVYDEAALGERCVLPFCAEPEEIRNLRRAVRAALGRWGAVVVSEEAELAVTELATNTIQHVGHGTAAVLVMEVRMDRLRLELHDKSSLPPVVGSGGCDEECGRGLHLLAAMSLDWGTLLTAAGKAVWCELPLAPVRRCPRSHRAATVLEAYQRLAGAGGQAPSARAVLEASATGVIADLLYWLALQGLDPDAMLDQAQTRYEAGTDAA